LDAKKQAIWIDLDNSPHVPLFAPVIKHYRDQGTEVILTARDHSQTIELLDLAGLNETYFVVGHHYGKGKFSKVQGLLVRAAQLASYIKQIRKRNVKISVALSHGSRSMVLAAKWLRIPSVTMYDYEFTETQIFNRFSHSVLVPERISDSVLDGIGLPADKRAKYPGLKEELYIRHFAPDTDFRERFLRSQRHGEMAGKVFVVLRPPAGTANYHSKQSDELLEAVLSYLLGDTDVFTVIVPRTVQQADEIAALAGVADRERQFVILNEAVNGLDLAFASDLLISGGGTMNREAALLGVPVYSIFAGRQGALDRQMEADGLITFIRDVADVQKIKLVPRDRDSQFSNLLTDRVERFVIEQINTFLKRLS
jgi:predicted glycosyltransferase